jgi:membrane fusion protein, multidrug efflux system
MTALMRARRGTRRMTRGVRVRLLVTGAVFLAVAGCGEKNTYVPPPPPRVIVAQPLQQQAVRYLELTGNTQAVATVDLEARVQGFLEKINYKDGSLAKKDTVLFVIERNTYEAQLQQAKATLAANQAAQVNSQGEYTRQSTLGRDQFASQAKVDDAKSKLDQAVAAVESSKANVDLATINLGYTEVRAPFAGVVTRHLVDIGALVGYPGPTKLATIVQIDPIYAYFNIAETTVLRIKEELAKRGRPLDIQQVPVEIGLQTEDGYPHQGHLDYVAPQVDPATGTLQGRAIFDNKDQRLLPGLFVRVRIPVQRIDNALKVADTAIGTSQLGDYLLVLGKDNIVEQRQVKIGQLDGQLRVIESGLNAEDWVVTSGVQRAIPGNKVEPEKRDMTVSLGGG